MRRVPGEDPTALSAGEPEALDRSPGELLRSERERRGLSIQQAAEDLHLDAATVQAIEADRFQELGAPVYARGHLRKYAEVLGLAPEYLLSRYEALADTPVVPVPVPVARLEWIRPERRSLKLPLAILVAVIALVLGWWLFGFVGQMDLGARGEVPGAGGHDDRGEVAIE